MNTTNSTVSSVSADFQIEKQKALNPTAVQVKNNVFENKINSADVSFSKQEINEMIEALNEYSEDLQTNFGFSVRELMHKQIVVEIKNKATDETIKQFPPEELLEIKEKMAELIGLMFDASV